MTISEDIHKFEKKEKVDPPGFEPGASALQTRRYTRFNYRPVVCFTKFSVFKVLEFVESICWYEVLAGNVKRFFLNKINRR